MREIEAVVDNDNDVDVQLAMRQRYHELPRGERPEMRAVLRMAAVMLYNIRMNGGQLSPRRALILLAFAGWDQTLAQDRYRALGGEGGDEDGDGSDEEDEESGESGYDVSLPEESVIFLLIIRFNRDEKTISL